MDNIFGITPVDAALSAVGLNISQSLFDFLFGPSKIAYLCFVIGFLYTLWQCAIRANYRLALTHLAIYMACLIIVFIPANASQEGVITSAWEFYSAQDTPSNQPLLHQPPALSTQALKSAYAPMDQQRAMPALLSFVGKTIDSFNRGSVAVISEAMPAYAQYLKYPFGLQEVSLRLHDQVQAGIMDIRLKQEAQDFIYDHYLPAISMFKQNNTSVMTDLSIYGPSNTRITAYYSQTAQQDWNDRQGDLKANIKTSMPSLWRGDMDILGALYPQDNATAGNERVSDEDMFLDALMQSEARALATEKPKKQEWLWQAAKLLLHSYPYAQGGANLCLYAVFPIVLCVAMAFARLQSLMHYVQSFVWVKSFTLTAALAYGISFLIAHAQSSTGDIRVFWQAPYFALAAGILAYVLPVVMFVVVYRGIKFKSY